MKRWPGSWLLSSVAFKAVHAICQHYICIFLPRCQSYWGSPTPVSCDSRIFDETLLGVAQGESTPAQLICGSRHAACLPIQLELACPDDPASYAKGRQAVKPSRKHLPASWLQRRRYLYCQGHIKFFNHRRLHHRVDCQLHTSLDSAAYCGHTVRLGMLNVDKYTFPHGWVRKTATLREHMIENKKNGDLQNQDCDIIVTCPKVVVGLDETSAGTFTPCVPGDPR